MSAALAWLCGALLAVFATDTPCAQNDGKAPAALNPDARPPAPLKPVMRSAHELPSTRFAADLAAANTEAIDQANRLRSVRAKSPPPANCERRLLRAGLKSGGFGVRPGQHVVIEGCLGGALPGMVRLNGSFPGGHLVLHVDEWTDTYVRARVPDVIGVFDGQVALQVRFGDGSFSNQLSGSFVARRATYELEPHQFGQFLYAIEKSEAGLCGWSATCPAEAPAQPGLPGTGGLMVYAERAASGTLAIRGHHPQHHVVGYFGRNDYGASQFSHWGPASELMVDWTTENYHGTHDISVLVVTRFVVDAPVATLPGARAYGVTPIVPTAALH